MGPLAFFRSMYTLDTLDTRFTSSSSVPYQTVIDARADPASKSESPTKLRAGAQPSLWRTPEYFVYSVILVLGLWAMIYVPYSVSGPWDPRYHKYQHLLSDGWLFGRKIDNTDHQYRSFRENLPYMTMLLIFHPLLRRLYEALRPAPQLKGNGSGRLEHRATFDYAFAILFLVVLHGFSVFKVFAILWLNFALATRLPKRYVPLATWVFNISILFANDMFSGYRYGHMARLFVPSLWKLGDVLDSYGGLMSRWEILFNITILRLISFNLDYYWSADKRTAASLEKKQSDPTQLSERERVSISADPRDYNFRNYVAYAIYAPLYLTGPIMTFNDYIAQCKHRTASIERPRTIRYAVRLFLCLLAMEFILHLHYMGAISKANPVWRSYTPSQLGLLSFINLNIIWLKLLLPWRLFRLWALVDGIDPPENMVRCVGNNYSTQFFWRSWHRSYSRWLIRYIYGPLGGSSFRTWLDAARSTLTYLIVFTFVALWHDIQMRLLVWGWLIVLFMLPERIAVFLFPPHKWESRPFQYRVMCSAAGVVNVLMMISANLVGFAVGVDGMMAILQGVLHEWAGFVFMVATFVFFVGAVGIMFEVREGEKRKGVAIRC